MEVYTMIFKTFTDSKEYLNIIQQYSNKKEPVLLIGVTTDLTVYTTGKNDTNFEAFKNLNAILIPYKSNGGTAVSAPGDLGIYFRIPKRGTGWCLFIYKELRNFLISYGIEANITNNDLTIHGKKVAGYTEDSDSNYSTGSIFIAMNNSQELVNEICLKPKTRETAGLSDYGLTVDEVIDVIKTATKKYLKLIGGE